MEDLSIIELFELSSGIAKELRDIYLISFPPEQRVSFRQIVSSFKKRETRLFVSILDNKLAGFASVTLLANSDALYLGYIATKAKLRNNGIGATILQNLKSKFQSEAKARGLIFEVEPEAIQVSPEMTIRKRRIEFYKRNGAVMVDCALKYKMPDQNAKGAVDMLLMWLPFDNSPYPPCGQKLEEYIKQIYIQVYNRKSDDPLLIEVLINLVC